MISGVFGSLRSYIYYESHKNVLFSVNHCSMINVHIYMGQFITNRTRGTVIQDGATQANRFLRPSYCGSVRTDFPLTVIGRKKKKASRNCKNRPTLLLWQSLLENSQRHSKNKVIK